MRLTSERMRKLMAYADGELDGSERLEVEGWLASDVDAVRFANELAHLGDLVTTAHEGSPAGEAVATFDIADAVMAKVTEKGDNPLGARVVSLEARRQKNLKVGGLVAAALGLAAAVFVTVRSRDADVPMARAPIVAPTRSPSVVSADPGVDVDVDETGAESVAVFYLASETSPTTSVVVWVDESGGK